MSIAGNSETPAVVRLSGAQEKWLSLLLCFYLSSLVVILSPESLLRERLCRPLKPIMEVLGLWQSWIVFAPELRRSNFHVLAGITYDDGSMQLFEFPRQERLTGIEKMRAERFRKWSKDRVSDPHYSFVLSDAARYIARLHADPLRRPLYVDFFSLSAPIPPPANGLVKPLPDHTQLRTFFVYKVQPGELQ